MSALAKKLIAENKHTRADSLDLGQCGLTEIPSSVGDLVWLESLSLADEWFEWSGRAWEKKSSLNAGEKNGRLNNLEPLRPLTNLRLLAVNAVADLERLATLATLERLFMGDVSWCNITPIAALSSLRELFIAGGTNAAPFKKLAFLKALRCAFPQTSDFSSLLNLTRIEALDLSDTRITQLESLSRLSTLKLLNISRTSVSDLAPIRHLSALCELSASATKIRDLEPLSGTTGIRFLDLSNTQVENLTPIEGLSELEVLNLSRTHVRGVTSLGSLSALRVLDLADTRLSDLMGLSSLSSLTGLNISHTPVKDISALSSLSHLEALNVSGTPVRELSALTELRMLQTLDISRSQVSDLEPIVLLPSLRRLNASATRVSSLPRLTGLPALESLDLSDCPIRDLTPLSSLTTLQTLNLSRTSTDEFSSLISLSKLRTLGLSETQIDRLFSLAGLPQLNVLDISRTQITDFEALIGFPLLYKLDLSDTLITDLEPISSLAELRNLNLSGTQVSNLSPLAGLANLESLDISDTQVRDLSSLVSIISKRCPVFWSKEIPARAGVYVLNCPLESPPQEIVNQGNKAILNYFHERMLGVDHLFEAKMLILGEGGAGKTSLLRRLFQPDEPLPRESETTKGISIFRHEFNLTNGRRFRLNVWDFGGQEIYHATHQFFLTRRSLYLLVDDTRQDHKSVSDEGFKSWLELIDVFGGHSPVLIFQNEKGGRSKAIDFGGIKGLYDNVKELYAGNLEFPNSAYHLRAGIEFFAGTLSHIGEELPARWVKVRGDIEVRAGEIPYISQEEYFQIYSRHMEYDRTKALYLSRYLHDLGVFLHFQDDPLLSRTVILQNVWATEAVFRILTDETVKEQFGRFNANDYERFWQDANYADMHPELMALVKRFELCYELRDSDPPRWLAPQLLPPAKPNELQDWGRPGDLVLRYRYEFLPKGLISRLTVRLHRFVRKPQMAWVTGVLLERETNSLLVELLSNGNEIELRSRGPEQKELLSVVAGDLDALNNSFQGLSDRVDKRIPCNCKKCRSGVTPHFYAQKRLLKRKADNKLEVECENSYEDTSVLALLDGTRIDQLPVWADSDSTERSLRIFIASSSELKEDRDEFDLYLRQQNDRLRSRGIYVEIVRWERFLDAMSQTRLQDEYNKEIRSCDIFVCLLLTKTGIFTEEEFNVAHNSFLNTGKPLIFPYFKNSALRIGSIRQEDLQSLWAFQARLKQLDHFHTTYDNIEGLKLHFGEQLEKTLDNAR